MARYKGKTEDGEWQEFEATTPEDATPEETGYVEVVKIIE